MSKWHVPILTMLACMALLLVACGGDHTRSKDDGTKKPDDGAPTVITADDPVTGDCAKFTQVGSDNAVAQGTKIPAGSCAIIEVLDHASKTEKLFAGKITEDFTPGVNGSIHMNAWAGFDNVASAERDMCSSTVPERRGQFPSYTFDVKPDCGGNGKDGGSPTSTATATAKTPTSTSTPKPAVTPAPSKTGKRITGACTDIPHADQVIALKPGAKVAKGTLVVVRFVNHTDRDIFIEAGCLLEDTTAGGEGMLSIDIWMGYSKLVIAEDNACGEAYARLNGSKIRGSWDYGYDVFLVGSDGKFAKAPETCP